MEACFTSQNSKLRGGGGRRRYMNAFLETFLEAFYLILGRVFGESTKEWKFLFEGSSWWINFVILYMAQLISLR